MSQGQATALPGCKMATCWACFGAPRSEESDVGSEDSKLPTKQCRNASGQVRPGAVNDAASAG